MCRAGRAGAWAHRHTGTWAHGHRHGLLSCQHPGAAHWPGRRPPPSLTRRRPWGRPAPRQLRAWPAGAADSCVAGATPGPWHQHGLGPPGDGPAALGACCSCVLFLRGKASPGVGLQPLHVTGCKATAICRALPAAAAQLRGRRGEAPQSGRRGLRVQQQLLPDKVIMMHACCCPALSMPVPECSARARSQHAVLLQREETAGHRCSACYGHCRLHPTAVSNCRAHSRAWA